MDPRPRPRSLVWVTVITLITSSQAGAQTQSDPHALPSKLGSLEYSLTIGEDHSFGNIVDVAAIGEVWAVLDGMNSRISVFGAQGNSLGGFGDRGRGPGEFFNPVALATDGRRLFVLDRGNLRIAILRLGPDSISIVDSIRIPVPNPVDLCSFGESLVVLGHHEGLAVHVLNGRGEVMRSFGRPLASDPTGGPLTATGKLACSDESGLIAFAPETLGHLFVFTPYGEKVWEGEIPGFVRQEYERVGAAGMRPRRPERGYIHRTVSLSWVGDESLVVPLGRVPTPEDSPMMDRWLLDLSRGEMAEAPSLPRSLFIGPSMALFEEVAPYPLIKVYREG